MTVCATAQHRELLDKVLRLADIVPDIDLNVMTANQTLDQLSARLLVDIGEVLDKSSRAGSSFREIQLQR